MHYCQLPGCTNTRARARGFYCSRACAWKAAEGRHGHTLLRNGEPIWTEDKISALASLWEHGFSTANIGTRLGFSKNAIVGKARRLGLPKRESPVPTHADSLWTDEMRAQLKDLWLNSQKNAAVIGRELGGFTGNAIKHKAHREGLGPRPWSSPVLRGQVRRKTLPELPVVRQIRLSGMEIRGNLAPIAALFDNPEDDPEKWRAPVRRAPEPLRGPRYSPHKTCQYLIGNDRRTWRQCDAPTREGSSYCATHHAKCYVPRKALMEAA